MTAGVVFAWFCCSVRAGITLTSPNGGEVWTAGDKVTVTWTFTPPTLATDEVVILIRDGVDGPGASIRFIENLSTATVTVDDGQASFGVPTWLGDGPDYRVEIRGESFLEIHASDLSDGPISIIGSGPTRRLNMRSPRGGARWRAGERAFVAWKAIGMDNVPVEVLLTPGIVQYAAVPASDGWAIIEVPANMGNAADYRIQLIEDVPIPRVPGLALVFDESPLLEIHDASARPTFFVISPNGSETLTGGDDVEICWGGTAQDERPFVTILDGFEAVGGLFSSSALEEGCASRPVCPYVDGNHFRVLAFLSPLDSLDLLRGGYLQLIDLSDGFFSINSSAPSPTLTLTSLNDGDTLTPNQQYAVNWTSSGFEGTEILAAWLVTYIGSTQTVDLIGAARVSGGTMPTNRICPSDDPQASYRVRICVSPNYCPQVCDESDHAFSIAPIEHTASFEIIEPMGGEVFRDGQFVDLEYVASNVDGLTVDVRRQVGAGFLNAFASGPAVNGTGSLSERLRLPGGEVASRAYRLVAQLKAGTCTILQKETGFFTVKNHECTCADINGDLLVNLEDVAALIACMDDTSFQNTSGLFGLCACADLDGSGQVDLRDYSAYQNLYGIGAAAEPPDCPQNP